MLWSQVFIKISMAANTSTGARPLFLDVHVLPLWILSGSTGRPCAWPWVIYTGSYGQVTQLTMDLTHGLWGEVLAPRETAKQDPALQGENRLLPCISMKIILW